MTAVSKATQTMLPTQRERIERVCSIHLTYPRFMRALAQIEQFMSTSRFGGDARGFLLTGEAGVGKTSLLNALESRHVRSDPADGRRIPVVHASITGPATIKGVAQDLLVGLGVKNPARDASVHSRTERIVELFSQCGVEMLIMDEFQHLAGTAKNNTAVVSNWVKSMMNKSTATFLLAGIPETVDILTSNSQLNSRFPYHIKLRPFNWRDDEEEFCNFLGGLEKAFADDMPIRLTAGDLPQRLLLASNGFLRPLMTLLRETLSIAILKNRDECGFEDLADRFATMRHEGSMDGEAFRYSATDVRKRLLEAAR